jgi:hypothetical protein
MFIGSSPHCQEKLTQEVQRCFFFQINFPLVEDETCSLVAQIIFLKSLIAKWQTNTKLNMRCQSFIYANLVWGFPSWACFITRG